MTSDGWVSFPFREGGGHYSLIVNPDASKIAAASDCGFWCEYQKWFYIGGSGVILVVIIVVVLVVCLGKKQYPVPVTKPVGWKNNSEFVPGSNKDADRGTEPKQDLNKREESEDDSDGDSNANYGMDGEAK